eukprot:Ihof_evm1s481 gene=Ihof_evmTU1s481
MTDDDIERIQVSPSGSGKEKEMEQQDKMKKWRLNHPEWYYLRPENPTWIQRLLYPYHDSRLYLKRLFDNFGYSFSLYLVSVYFGLLGFGTQLLNAAQLPYFLDFLRVSSTNYQIFNTVALVPWSLKPFWGIVSDAVPIFGYHKSSYVTIGVFLGVTGFFVLSFADMTPSIAPIAAIMFFLGNLEISIIDLMTEATYAEQMALKPETSSDIVTWSWMWSNLGTLLSTWVVGPLGSAYKDQKDVWLLRAQVIIPVLLGWNKDTRLPAGNRGVRYDRLKEFKRPFVLGLVVGTLALGVAVISMVNGYVWYDELAPKYKLLPVFAFGIFSGLVMILLSFWAFSRKLACVVTYLFIAQLFYININGPLTTFYTSSENCIRNGPHFSQFYYITLSGTVGAVFSTVGVVAFQAIMSGWYFRPCFWVSTCLANLAGVVDIIIIKRWNVDIGIPDKAMYMLGDSIIYQTLYMVNYMPAVVLISKMCPKGMESTMYALMSAYSNFGQ